MAELPDWSASKSTTPDEKEKEAFEQAQEPSLDPAKLFATDAPPQPKAQAQFLTTTASSSTNLHGASGGKTGGKGRGKQFSSRPSTTRRRYAGAQTENAQALQQSDEDF